MIIVGLCLKYYTLYILYWTSCNWNQASITTILCLMFLCDKCSSSDKTAEITVILISSSTSLLTMQYGCKNSMLPHVLWFYKWQGLCVAVSVVFQMHTAVYITAVYGIQYNFYFLGQINHETERNDIQWYLWHHHPWIMQQMYTYFSTLNMMHIVVCCQNLKIRSI
jgi:hypothetical protein